MGNILTTSIWPETAFLFIPSFFWKSNNQMDVEAGKGREAVIDGAIGASYWKKLIT
jgi:hypothetical protein